MDHEKAMPCIQLPGEGNAQQGTEHQLPSEAVRAAGSARCQAEAQELDLFLASCSPLSPGKLTVCEVENHHLPIYVLLVNQL